MNIDQERKIKEMLSGKHFVLVGAGQLGEMAISIWPHDLPPPLAVLDSNKTGFCLGVGISALKGFQMDPKPVFLLSAFKIGVREVSEIFADLGQDLVLTVYDFFEHHCPSVFSNGWRNLEADNRKISKIASVRECFSDSRSLEVFDAAVDWRYRRVLTRRFECESENTKYDVRRYGIKRSQYGIVIDCGAFDLSLASYLHAASIKVERYVAFEPDRANLARCMAAQKQSLAGIEAVELQELALFEEPLEQRFLESGLLSSRIVADVPAAFEGQIKTVKTTTLDNYFCRSELNGREGALLKLHLEGAEIQVLRGAVNLIKDIKPDVFVNLSHDEVSLLDIPLFFRDMGGYQLSLAGHSLFGEGITLFATKCDRT